MRTVTDEASHVAVDAMEEFLTDAGFDRNHTWLVVLCMISDGHPDHASLLGSLPGEPTPERLLQHVVKQLEPLAAECGVAIRLDGSVMN